MKLTIFYLLAFGFGGSTSPIKRANLFQVQGLNASVYSNNTLGTLHFAVQNPSDSVEDQCFISWNPSGAIQPGIEFNKCAQNNFQFGFRYGLQIENFVLDLQQVNTTQTIYHVLSVYARNSNWVCTKNPSPEVKESCEYQGVLSIGS
ncbi:hypothetical protein N7528_003344 [Penicillium herquei]|nr:hypothetical protein N7528_003344 [Penicillium herquei]